MTRTKFLTGISALAFAATGAAAQTTTNGDTTDPNSGNRIFISCTTGSANVCSVDQGTSGQTFNSQGAITVTGNNNTSTISQRGNRQSSENRTTGAYNSAISNQNTGFNNRSAITQSGTGVAATLANSATVTQGGGSSTANGNLALVGQTRTAGAASTVVGNQSTVNQATGSAGGFNNTVTATQDGTGLISTVNQADQGSTLAASNNSATVSQGSRMGVASTGTTSNLTQQQVGNTASVFLFDGGTGTTSRNVSDIQQGNLLFLTPASGTGFATANGQISNANNPRTDNSAIVSISGQQNSSSVTQNGVQNTADVTIVNGGTGNTNTANANGGTATNPGTGVSLSPNAGGQPNNRPQGNSSTINQQGRGNYAAVSSGARVTYTGSTTLTGGAGNISSITQTQLDPSVTATTLNSTQTATTAHRALVYQRGTLDSVTIDQSNNMAGGSGANTVQSGSLADVSQLSFNSTTSVTQVGTNTARVTQGARNEQTGASNQITLMQTDAGDITTPTGGSGGGGFGGGSAGSTTGTSRNFAEVVQYGVQNTATVTQNARNASTTVFQATATRSNFATVLQGTGQAVDTQSNQQATANAAAAGAASQNLVAIVNQTAGGAGAGAQVAGGVVPAGLTRGVVVVQNGVNLTARADQAGGTVPTGTGTQTPSNNAIGIAQAGSNGSATVSQSGTNLSASVEMRGANTDTTRLNLVRITQTNNNNRALARQTGSVGASVAGDMTAGVTTDMTTFPNSRSGANSAEIVISQSGTGGSATIEQQGKGQYASITQTGTTNTAGILQGANATNAVAIIEQSGSNNAYYINQTAAGQYARVVQNGANNTVTNGPSGDGGATTTPITTFGTSAN